jgi:hypothetical protein
LEASRESVTQLLDEECERLDRVSAPLDLDALFGDFGRTPCFKRCEISTIEKLHDIVHTLTEAHAQSLARQPLQIAARG